MSRTSRPLAATKSRWPKRFRRLLTTLAFLQLGLVLGVVGLIYGPGERFWGTTLVLFGPTWVFAVPLVVLAGAAVALQRRLIVIVPLLLSAVFLLDPVLAFNIPWQRLVSRSNGAPRLRLLTWNIGGGSFSTEALSEVLEQQHPDVVVLQECSDDVAALAAPDPPWHRHASMGMCLLSRFPIREIAERERQDVWVKAGSGAIIRYALEAPFGVIDLTNVHLETPREGLEAMLHGPRSGVSVLVDKNRQRYEESALAMEWASKAGGPARLVAGDFNTPPQSDLLRDGWPGYTDCFEASGFGLGHTKHTRKLGVRIDHVLAASGWRCSRAFVPSERSSDHDPVVVDLEWNGGSLQGYERAKPAAR